MRHWETFPTKIPIQITLVIIFCLLTYSIPTTYADTEKPTSYDPTEELPPITSRLISDITGLVEPENWWENVPFDPCESQRNLPPAYDWRDFGGDPPIRDQGSCGACWAFATTGALECNIKINHNRSVDLSEQWLVNCNQDGWDCDGGWFAHDYHMWKTDPCGGSGAVLEQYVPYSALNDPCNCPYPHDYFINNWSYIGDDQSIPSINSMKQAILDHGPISVAIRVNLAFQQYTGGIYNIHSPLAVNHAVVLVGWNDTQGTNGVWLLRNSWGPGWGENGYMRIEYGINSVGYAACYVNYSPALLEFNLPNWVPEVFTPNIPANFTVEINEIGDTLIPLTPTLHYRYDNGSYNTLPLIPIGGNKFKAVFPPAFCDDTPEYYISAHGVKSGLNTFPTSAPTDTITSFVGFINKLYIDDFSNDTGWIVTNSLLLTDGEWERGIPIGGGDRGDPSTDYDGSGYCYLTDNVDGNSDVDGGSTYLSSPILDLSNGTLAVINYAIWYTNYFDINPHDDYFNVYLSNDGGTNHHLIQTIGPYSVAAWIPYQIVVNDYLTPTDQMQVVFEASDLGLGSIVEAGVDTCNAYTLNCYSFIPLSDLTSEWNLFSLPFNQSLDKSSIIVEYNSTLYSWNDTVQNGLILDFIYSWNRTSQTSEIFNTLIPGYSYWSYAYYPVTYYSIGVENIIYDSYVTSVEENWNLINTPYDFGVHKTNLSIYYYNQFYTWDAAVGAGLILPFLYGWDELSQTYILSDNLLPGQGTWFYSYVPCHIFDLQV